MTGNRSALQYFVMAAVIRSARNSEVILKASVWGVFRAWKPPYFLALCIIAIVVTRLLIIGSSPRNDEHIDLSIYREVGEQLVNGVDPYAVHANQNLRETLRLNEHGAIPWVREPSERYDYYVTSNLPGSTLLYGAFEWLSNGNARVWRYLLISGDISIALAAFFLLRRAGITLDTIRLQVLFSLAVVYYPSLLVWGTLIPEDKQFQTASMLVTAGLLTGAGRARPVINAALIGLTGGFSIMFKALGVFLAPVAIRHFLGRPRFEFFVAVSTAILFMLLVTASFDTSFIVRAANRFLQGSNSYLQPQAFHASPWQFIPPYLVAFARPIACIALGALAVASYMGGRIDLLNFCAAICVIFICLWIVGGSMDRANIAMMFALMSTATISVRLWASLVLLNSAVQWPLYVVAVFGPKWEPSGAEIPDAISITAFVLFYIFAISRLPHKTDLERC